MDTYKKTSNGWKLDSDGFNLLSNNSKYLTKKFNEPYQIFHGKGFICIDCGCGNLTNPYRRLACLRLEDMAEFYV